jgi:hypothetical protein
VGAAVELSARRWQWWYAKAGPYLMYGSVLLLSWLVLRRDGELAWSRWERSSVVSANSAGIGVRIVRAGGLRAGGEMGGLDVLWRLHGPTVLRVRVAL